MTFSTPQAGDNPSFAAQAVVDATDLAAILAASTSTGWVSGCAITPNSSGVNLNINVAAGSVVIAGTTVAVSAATNVTVAAASGTDRRDAVTINSSGTVVLTAGTPCAVAGWTTSSGVLPPVKPAIPASSTLIGEVYVPGGATSITAGNIVAKAAPTGTSGGLTRIAQTVLGVAAATIDFTSIPATYTDLVVAFQGRDSTAATFTQGAVTFNGDTGLNYDDESDVFTAGSATSTNGSARASIRFYVAGDTAAAGYGFSWEMLIHNYAGTTFHKTVAGFGAGKVGTAVPGLGGGVWHSTVAINRVTLTAAATFKAGTIATLYGRS